MGRWDSPNARIEKVLQEYIRPRDDIAFKRNLCESVSFKISSNFKENDKALKNFQYLYDLYDAIGQYFYMYIQTYILVL